MLLSREAICQDKSVDQFTDAILTHDQPRVAELFFNLVKKDGRSMGDALVSLTAAEAPFVQVPNHINIKDGQITLINNDHTILGLRTSAALAPYLPAEYQMLPMLQSVWYVPAGLDIWNQLLGKYPGRYATMKGMNVPLPKHGPVVWNDEQQPIVEPGTVDERLHSYMIATMSGDVKRSYGLFLGLAAEESARPALRDTLLFLGLIDVQDTVIGRKARNTGHKALRARAVVDLADYIGWERAHGVYYTGVPDMAIGPLYYSAYDAACVTLMESFPDGGKTLKQTNISPLSREEVEDFVRLLMEADTDVVWAQVTGFLRTGKSIKSIADTIQIGAAELILRNVEPRKFTDGQHPFDYCNTANYWMRGSENPYQARILYLMANFVNDVARSNKFYNSVLEQERAGFNGAGRTPDTLLQEIDQSIIAFDFAHTTSLAHAYLQAGGDRKAYLTSVAITACKFQDDPHNQKISHSTFEEYEHNSTHLRDRLLLAAVRLLAGWPKMPGERDCYARFMREWIRH
ncbi:MAG: hypothetical protein EXR05_08945 [Acetobacteraceae bacterium]|nr:hypothetical protein [Acetobacteraceae bacterium]MSP30000.1 hypothetical protein [Acetobacteraceae bacterium]